VWWRATWQPEAVKERRLGDRLPLLGQTSPPNRSAKRHRRSCVREMLGEDGEGTCVLRCFLLRCFLTVSVNALVSYDWSIIVLLHPLSVWVRPILRKMGPYVILVLIGFGFHRT
jgi:hypothetical protein